MKKHILLLIFNLTLTHLRSQVTFEKIYGAGQFNSAIELDSSYFLMCGSDSLHGGIFQLDGNGNFISSVLPMLRGDYVTIADLKKDTISKGIAICGTSPDTSGGNETGFYLVLDSSFQNLDNVLYSGGINGPDGVSILRTSKNDYVVGTETWLGVGNYASVGNKVIYSGTSSWTAGGGSNLSGNGMDLDANDNLLIAGFSWTGAAAAHLDLYDSSGASLYSFDITDTAHGNSLVFESCASAGPNNTYLFGVDLSPSALTYSLPYINCLDAGFNVLWQKYLDWGFNVNLIGMRATSDSCIVYLLGTDNGLALYKMRANGDSLWIQYHNRPTTGLGARFIECADRGFLVVGVWSDSAFVSHQYALKTDSLGRLLPQAVITSNGPSTVCPGDTVELSAPPGYSYLWSNFATTRSIRVTQPGPYQVQVTDTNSYTALSDTFFVNNFSVQTPVITLNGQDMIVNVNGTYQWFSFGVPIPGANQSTYPASDGTWSVEVTDSNGCVMLSADLIITGVTENINESIIIDTQDQVIIRNQNGIDKFQIFDIAGKIVSEGIIRNQQAVIYKTDLMKGIYILSVTDKEGRSTRKKIERY